MSLKHSPARQAGASGATRNSDDDPIVFLSKREVARRIGFHPESVMRLVRQGRFPAPVRFSGTKLGFVASEVSSWQMERMAERVSAETEAA